MLDTLITRDSVAAEAKTSGPVPVATFLRDHFAIEADPSDAEFQQQYTNHVIDGFRLLSLLVFVTMAALVLAHLLQWGARSAQPHEALSLAACGVLAASGAAGLMVSKLIQSRTAAYIATAVLLTASIAVLTVDRLQQFALTPKATPSLIPVLLLMLMLGAAVMPLRPGPIAALGDLLVLSCAIAARFTVVTVVGNVNDFIGAAMAVLVAVAISARSTAQRIRVHQAHEAALQAERDAEAARERAFLAESAITMERLAAPLSHELNTPIGALKSAADTLTRGIEKHASFSAGSTMPMMVKELSTAIRDSAARLTETVSRIQRFANLDRGAIRLADINQLVQDSVALMNPPSAARTKVELVLTPVPQIWCRPHSVSMALAYILDTIIEAGSPATIQTFVAQTVVVEIATEITAGNSTGPQPADLGFAVVQGRVRAGGWEMFAARQLIRQTGGELRVERTPAGGLLVVITLPADTGAPPLGSVAQWA